MATLLCKAKNISSQKVPIDRIDKRKEWSEYMQLTQIYVTFKV